MTSSCGSSGATKQSLAAATHEVDALHADALGDVLGRGTYGSAGVSGDRPTAFVAVRSTRSASDLLDAVTERVKSLGSTAVGRCAPPEPCLWSKHSDAGLVRTTAVILGAGQTWGRSSTTHGIVPGGATVLQLSVTVGG